MNKLTAIGKFLDQPRLVGKFSKTVPAILIGGAALITANQVKKAPTEEKRKTFIQNASVLTGTIASALIATRGIKRIGLKGLSESIDLKELARENTKLVDDFLQKTKVSDKVKSILDKAKTKIMSLKEIKIISKELKSEKSGDEFLKKLIPDPENITAKDIFKEIKRLSIMGLVPVLGGIAGGVIGDKLTDKNWKEKVPNKIKEGTYQYLANIFMCNVGAGIALAILEKAKIKSKTARALGMTTGIVLTGIIGGSIIANAISRTVIDPICGGKSHCHHNKHDLYSERKPEAIDIGLHADDIATVAVLSGLKWIEPALPVLYSVSGYRAGMGYRNGDCKKSPIQKINDKI